MLASRALFGCLALSAAAGAEKSWTLDAIMNIPALSDPQIAPDGRTIAYTLRTLNSSRNAYDSHIWAIPAAGGRSQPLPDPHFSDHYMRWSPDGGRLAFLSSRDGGAQIYVTGLKQGASRKLTNSLSGVTSFAWSPSGNAIGYLALDAPDGEEAARVRRGNDAIVADQGYKFSRVYVIATDGGIARKVTYSDRHVISFDWAPDAAKIVYAGQPTPRNRDSFDVDIYVVDLATGLERPLVRQPGRDAEPSWSPDGKWIAFHSQAGSRNYFEARHVGLTPAAGGAIRYITESFGADVFRGATRFAWAPDELVFGAGKGTRDYLYAMNHRTGGSRVLVESLAGTSSFSFSGDGSCAFLKASNSRPPEIWLAARDGATSQLTRVHDNLSEYPSMAVETVSWKSADGMPMEGVLWLPPHYQAGARIPLLVELHGGPTGVALENFPVPRTYPTQMFAQLGFAVFAPNFRGSANYGAKLRLANIDSQGFGDFDDVMTGIDMLVAKGIADPQRLGVMGWSYGGFLTAWIIGHTNRFKAASIGAPATDWITYYGASDGPREVLWTYFGGKPWDKRHNYDRHSPRYSLSNVRTPALLQHGERDIDHCAEIYQALTDLNVPVEFVTYPREGHGIAEPAHQADLMRRNLAWFRKWIGTNQGR